MNPIVPDPDSSEILRRFRSLVDEQPDAPALIDGTTGRVTTRRELLDRSDAIGSILRNSRLAPGDFVGLQLRNGTDFLASFLAILRHRMTLVPLDRDARETEIRAVVARLSLRALVTCSPPEGLRVTRIALARQDGSIWNDHLIAPPAWSPLVKLTSGSTGDPKGIPTSEANLLADCDNICRTMGISADDRNLGAIPFSHSYGFSNLVMPLLVQGTAVIVSNDYLSVSILELGNRHHCTVVPGIPMMFEHLAHLPSDAGRFDTVRTFISAGAPLAASVSRRFFDRFDKSIHSFYGCSECGGIAYDREGGSVERGTVGAPLEGVSVRLDPLSGRLLVRSAAVASGYLGGRSPDERLRFSDGELRTDDLAELDETGELRLTGRAGDLINIAGKKVNPKEVESVLLRMEGVREARAFGVPAGARGEVVAVVVVADPHVQREDLRQFCRAHLAPHKVPRVIKLMDSIPLDDRGKFRRSAVSAL